MSAMIELHDKDGNKFYLNVSDIKSVKKNAYDYVQITVKIETNLKKTTTSGGLFSKKITEYEYNTGIMFHKVFETIDEVMELILQADVDVVDFPK